MLCVAGGTRDKGEVAWHATGNAGQNGVREEDEAIPQAGGGMLNEEFRVPHPTTPVRPGTSQCHRTYI